MLSLLKLLFLPQFHALYLHFWSVMFMCCIFMSCNFMSCNFTSCKLIRHFHVQHFQSTHQTDRTEVHISSNCQSMCNSLTEHFVNKINRIKAGLGLVPTSITLFSQGRHWPCYLHPQLTRSANWLTRCQPAPLKCMQSQHPSSSHAWKCSRRW